MLNLYQLECRVAARKHDFDTAIRPHKRVAPVRATFPRAVHVFRSTLRRLAGAWFAPRRVGGVVS